MDLGEIAHLPKPITLRVHFSSFVFHILLLDFGFPRWSVNLAFSTSFFTVLFRAGARRPHFPQWFFYNISCYLSAKSSNLRHLHQRQILCWNSFLHCAPTSPSTAHSSPGTTSKAWGVSDVNAASLWGLTVTDREVEGGSKGQLAQVPSHHRTPRNILMVKQSRRQHELAGRLEAENNT